MNPLRRSRSWAMPMNRHVVSASGMVNSIRTTPSASATRCGKKNAVSFRFVRAATFDRSGAPVTTREPVIVFPSTITRPLAWASSSRRENARRSGGDPPTGLGAPGGTGPAAGIAIPAAICAPTGLSTLTSAPRRFIRSNDCHPAPPP